MKITRRKLAAALAAPAARGGNASGRAGANAGCAGRSARSREGLASRRTATRWPRKHVPMSTEPAFQFKA